MKILFQNQHIKEFIKFSLIGGLSTAVNYSIFFLLLHFADFYYLLASAIGFICGIFVSYSLNRKFTFTPTRENRVQEFFFYVLICLFSLALSLLVLRFCVENLKLSPLLGNLFAIGVSTITNFTGAKLFVFKKYENNNSQS